MTILAGIVLLIKEIEVNEFEQWDRDLCDKCVNRVDYSCGECENLRESAWKAALEKVRHIVMFESDGPSNPKDLMQWIDKELNNE